ncbi:divalent-cation tolerance protein CutA [Candidatus Methylospira mobilis]|uniref:Divalent-cation tolerance protein CutA n=1 Tax=Candidatus Methylospira mobilis TaxID=1808979 RepID=A0A5Q0BH05_9GAMM|nr:divalent-cation tolerance protein CutA [Candidatus Methylospira mobilis]QFY41491.1 divalent-cation tolerance protein CutA [Candidatus Methylospira mobilis]WNV05280.1 divalent-cation tolerance protein CutA [Candidatus Methylospira mobilis]
MSEEKPEKATIIVVCCTCPQEKAAELARFVIESQLAACVNILPEVRSIYRWNDKICDETESLLLIKTGQANYAELERSLRERHPYEVPEIVAIPIERGLPDYLQWVASCIGTDACAG